MKNLLLVNLFIVGTFNWLSAQSDGCSAATSLSVTTNCTSPTAGTTTGATQTIPGCTGNADDDVWYQFTATATSHQIVVTASTSFDPVVQLFSGACSSLTSLVCKDDFGTGAAETINFSGLTVGQVYRIRVYHYGLGSGSGNFTICVTTPPPAPLNDSCSGAISLNVNSSCTYTNATTNGATQSLIGCSGNADDDVWFSFTATNSVQTISALPSGSLDLVVQVFSGTCGSLNSINCTDATFSGQEEIVNLVGLVVGQTYFVRVYDYYTGVTGNFQICVSGTSTATPTNDEPCNAIQLPAVTTACQYLEFTTVGATASLSAPTPSACVGGSGAAIGGFNSSTKDVWFSITVPESGQILVTPQPNMGAGSITDGVMALYSGTCSSLTQIACSDDHNYPGSANDLLPFLNVSGLTPGTIVYLRYWGFNTSQGTFGLCVTTATNDNCANALYICDINGYSAMTSAAYTPDRPCNMHGNNETSDGVNQPDGVNTGGIFGQGGPWGTGSPFFDVNIENNSWIKFTASATTAVLQVSIYDCFVGNYPSGGIQMQIFSGNNCCDFIPVSNFEENSSGFTITANNLTVGNDYYLMVDGYAGDICSYTITAESGVQFPDIAEVAPICQGQSVILTAPPGATSYEWQHNGATTQSVSVSPATTQTYYCEVTGLCGFKQMLDVVVTVIANPAVSITNGTNVSICSGQSVTLNATGATTYSWSNGTNGASTTVSPLTNTMYTVTGTANGCIASTSTTVQVNSNPTLSVNPTATDADCGGSNGALTGAVVNGTPSFTYSWTNGSGTQVGTSLNLSGVPAGVYTLTVTDGNFCSGTFGPFSIINPGAPTAPGLIVSDPTPCLNSSITFSASSEPGATLTWSGPNGFSSSDEEFTLNSITSTNSGTYCVYATLAGCSGPASCEIISIQALPIVVVGINDADLLICLGSSFELNASGGTSYEWTAPNGTNTTGSSIVVTSANDSNTGIYEVEVTDVNGCNNSGSIEVGLAQLPDLNLSSGAVNDTYCSNSIIQLTAGGATSYVWNTPSGGSSNEQTLTITNADANDEGWYIVTGLDENSCSNADSILIHVITNFYAVASAGDSVICPGDPINLLASNGSSFLWTGPLSFSSTSQNPIITNAQLNNTGWYTVYVTDENGCQAEDSVYILVTNSGDCFLIPTLFTPDGDPFNQTWVINGIENYLNAEVEIYNRWGNMVYFSSPYNNDWDGTVNRGTIIDSNGKVPVGTYFFIIRLNDLDNKEFKGYVEVQY
jgi:gliding motility-associated-like protein